MILYQYKYSPQYEGMKFVLKIITNGYNSCTACRELGGKRFTVDEALEQMPLPVKDCDNEDGWCMCYYSCEVQG